MEGAGQTAGLSRPVSSGAVGSYVFPFRCDLIGFLVLNLFFLVCVRTFSKRPVHASLLMCLSARGSSIYVKKRGWGGGGAGIVLFFPLSMNESARIRVMKRGVGLYRDA